MPGETGVGAARVPVRPPATPARPRISLLTQDNVDGGDVTVINGEARGAPVDGQYRPTGWIDGAGSTWLDPVTSFESDRLYQSWPNSGGTTLSTKAKNIVGDTDRTVTRSDTSVQPVQRPLLATMVIDAGQLISWALRNEVEGSIDTQAERAFDAALPRVIERELWVAAGAQSMNYASQFRLQGADMAVTHPTSTAHGYLRAFAMLESAVGNGGFLDQWGGAFYHVTRGLAALLLASSHGLNVDPSGRTIVSAASGARVVPESGATGIWPAGTGQLGGTPGSAAVGDDEAGGWLIASAPVRVRLGERYVDAASNFSAGFTNDRTVVVEQAFILESRLEVVAVPVDYTKEL